MKKNSVFSQLLLLLLLFSIYTVQAQVPEPQRLLEETSRQMVDDFIKLQPQILNKPEIAHDLINKNLVPIVNFSLMSQWVLGKNWRKASAAQQQQFTAQFRELVIKFYSKALLKYLEHNKITPDIISFQPFRDREESRYVTVRSLVHPPQGGESIKVNYNLYQNKSGKWQVYDVSVEGISMVTTYRSSFKDIISKRGMDALLVELDDKIKDIEQPAEVQTSKQAN